MKNPWVALPQEQEFVLKEDRAKIYAYNEKVGRDDDHWIHLELIPEPFLGRPDAPVLLLSLNPGYSEEELAYHRDPLFIKRSMTNLLHGAQEYPLFLLDPAIAASPGGGYWRQRLSYLIGQSSDKAVANSVLCVEYFPYHSRKYKPCNLLHSQEYGFELVRNAIRRGATIVGLRSFRFWGKAVPELATYAKYFQVNSTQNPTITKNNLPTGFDVVVEAINSK